MKNNYVTSANGVRKITAHEGEILKVYKDPIGLPTFGVGHLVKPEERAAFPVGKKISKAISQQYLIQDLQRFEKAVNNAVKVPITQNQFDALVSFAFNVGERAFRKSSVLRNLNNRKFTEAADSLLLWVKAGGRTLPGLVKRRKEERALFLTPDKFSRKSFSTEKSVATQIPLDNPLTSVDAPQIPDTFEESAADTLAGEAEAGNIQNTDANKETKVEVKDGNVTVETSEGKQPDEKIAIEKTKAQGFLSKIWKKITGVFGGAGVTDVITEKLAQVQAFGLSETFWKRIFYLAIIAGVVYLIFELIDHVQSMKRDKEITNALVRANTTDNNQVVLVDAGNIEVFKQQGYKIIYR